MLAEGLKVPGCVLPYSEAPPLRRVSIASPVRYRVFPHPKFSFCTPARAPSLFHNKGETLRQFSHSTESTHSSLPSPYFAASTVAVIISIQYIRISHLVAAVGWLAHRLGRDKNILLNWLYPLKFLTLPLTDWHNILTPAEPFARSSSILPLSYREKTHSSSGSSYPLIHTN